MLSKHKDTFLNQPFDQEKYKELLLPTKTIKGQRYLSFLDDLNTDFKGRLPKTGPFRGTCDDKLNKAIEKLSLKAVFDKNIDERGLRADFKRDPCVAISNYLCEFTDPNMYLTESQMPPRWLMKSLKDAPLPMHVDIACYNKTYNCCRAGSTTHTNPIDMPKE